MPRHTDNTRPPAPAPTYQDGNHALTLSDREAYQVWYLSYTEETGDSPGNRIHTFFDDETRRRFHRMKKAGVRP